MLPIFIELTDIDGDKFVINTSRILLLEAGLGLNKGRTCVTYSGGFVYCQESLKEVVAASYHGLEDMAKII